MQVILRGYDELAQYLAGRNILFVHGRSLEKFTILSEHLQAISTCFHHFTDFKPNPTTDDAHKAVQAFTDNKCDAVLAVGGGSAMDTAKFVKLKHPDASLAVIPTTAGSGSEATRFAVLYENGRKLSITDDNILPEAVMFDASLLEYLPEYHRKSSALDALCHSLESFWSVNADCVSRNFSREALTKITALLENYPASYDPSAMLEASYLAGKAINIAQTTAGHAMCYKITGIFGTAHGHSAAMCCRVLFRYLARNTKLPVLNDIADAMKSEQEIFALSESVNPERLRNFPAKLDGAEIHRLYSEILNVKER